MTFGDVIGLIAIVAGVIAVVGILAGAYKRRLAFHERKLELMAAQVAERAANQAAQTGALEGRLEVLERIVTDRGFDVARQIEALRAPVDDGVMN